MYDFTYVENVAHAHVCAERALATGGAAAEKAAGNLTYKLLAPYGMKVPQFTPSRIRLMSRSRTFSCSKASDRIGYTPIVPLQEGLKRTIESYPHLRAERVPGKKGPSKSSAFLWMFFLMVVFSLLIISILGTISLWSLFIIGIAAAFVVFFIYDKRKKK